MIGKPITRAGVKTFMPRGMSNENDFNEALQSYTPDVLREMVPDGKVYLRGRPVSLESFSNAITNFGMRMDGHGNYVPMSNGAVFSIDPAMQVPLRLPVKAPAPR